MSQHHSSIQHYPSRFYFVLIFIALLVLFLIGRVFDLAILDQPFLKREGDERVLRLVSTPTFRGMIVDRNGYPLAVSTAVYSVWMNPKIFTPTKEVIANLSRLLQLHPKEILLLYKHNQEKKREFVYLKRGVSPLVAKKIKSLAFTGINLQQEYRRYYPEGEVTAHLVGFTNVDDRGQEGLELSYNNLLSGEAGKKWVVKDRLGRIISDVQKVQDEKPGHDLVLSIDRRIQYLAYRELLTGVIENKASAASAIVLSAKTGEVLAMVNYPSFNPNARPIEMNDTIRNRAVTDIFEPGSTIKAFSIASALEAKHIKPDSIVDTTPGWMRVGHNIVRDEHNNGVLSVAQILQKSSNVGVSKIILGLPPNQLYSFLRRMGFGEVTGVGFPGEQSGSLVQHDPWGSFVLATLSFGYGISITTMQLARAYDVLANHGVKIPVTLLKIDGAPKGERVIDEKITDQMLKLLESVVMKGGTGFAARVPGYHVAAKSGTAVKNGIGGYEKNHYTSSFVGVAPLTDPQLVVAVVMHNPQGKKHLGGDVSGPVFERIMESTLRLLAIPPDDAASFANP